MKRMKNVSLLATYICHDPFAYSLICTWDSCPPIIGTSRIWGRRSSRTGHRRTSTKRIRQFSQVECQERASLVPENDGGHPLQQGARQVLPSSMRYRMRQLFVTSRSQRISTHRGQLLLMCLQIKLDRAKVSLKWIMEKFLKAEWF